MQLEDPGNAANDERTHRDALRKGQPVNYNVLLIVAVFSALTIFTVLTSGVAVQELQFPGIRAVFNRGQSNTPSTAPSATNAVVTATTPGASPTLTPTATPLPVPALAAPAVANAAVASQYKGQEIIYYGDGVGIGNELDTAVANRFRDDTGVQVRVIPRINDPTTTYETHYKNLEGESGDVYLIDIVEIDALGKYFVNLSKKMLDTSIGLDPTLVDQNTVNGSLVAVPLFIDYSLLYYNQDLLSKYRYSPPTNWSQLENQAEDISKRENNGTVGYLFQGDNYEGLTCEIVEWYASMNAGRIVDKNSVVNLDTQNGRLALDRVSRWIGGIAPGGSSGVLTDQEGSSIAQFVEGKAIFMRGWGTAFAEIQRRNPTMNVGISPLPGKASCLGGWQLAVPTSSKHQEAAIEFVRYLSSREVQLWRAVHGGFTPTFPDLRETIWRDPDLSKKMPIVKIGLDADVIPRPSKILREQYNAASAELFTGVHQILDGQQKAAQVLPGLQRQLEARVQQAVGPTPTRTPAP
jgi:trehalose/maltose transport system substrate-binding protein